MNEEDLIQGVINKERDACRELFDMYSKRIYNTALNFMQNEQDAEDITQEVFIEIFSSIQKFDRKAGLFTWIYRIAVNKSLEELRKRNTKKRFGKVISIFSSDFENLNLKDFSHPGVLLENKERTKILYEAIDKLPDKQKSAYILCKIEGLSNAETADILKASVSSVESLLFRANENLRKILTNFYKKNRKFLK